MKRKRILIYLIPVVIILLVAVWFFSRGEKTGSLNFQTAEVVSGSVSNTVTATGTVEPLKQVEVGTQVSGVIKKIYVDFNSVVKSGQLLAEIDKTPLLAQLASVEADLQSAESQLIYQEANFVRIKALFEKKAVSETDYETALYQFSSAKASVSKMKSEVDRAKTNLGYSMIFSPINGVILNRAVDEGQTVAASFNTPTLFTIAQDLTKMQVVANVDEADIGQVKEGQKVSFTVDAFPDESFGGTITQVRLRPVTTNNVVTYSVVIDAPNPELKLKPGLTASIVVRTREANGVLVVPTKAFRYKPDSALLALAEGPEKALPVQESSGTLAEQSGESQTVVKADNFQTLWVRAGSSIRLVQVETGLADETNTEIRSGISKGEQVVISSSRLAAGEKTSGAASQTQSSPFMPKPPGKK